MQFIDVVQLQIEMLILSGFLLNKITVCAEEGVKEYLNIYVYLN